MRFYLCSSESGGAGNRFSRFIFLILFLSLSGFPKLQAQQEMDYTIQANILYRFTKYINWPDNRKSGDFIIGTIGESPVIDELKNFVNNKTVGSQKIVVKRIPASTDISNCHILFICEDESKNIKKIAQQTASHPILLVTESTGLARKGSCINFIIVGDHLKLEINKTCIDERHLDIASELLQLGIIIK